MLPDRFRQLPQGLFRKMAAGLAWVRADALDGQHMDAPRLKQGVFHSLHKNSPPQFFSILRLVRRKREQILSEGEFYFSAGAPAIAGGRFPSVFPILFLRRSFVKGDFIQIQLLCKLELEAGESYML